MEGEIPFSEYFSLCDEGIKKVFDIKKLDEDEGWEGLFRYTFDAGYSANHVIEVCAILQRSLWRNYPVSVKMVKTNLRDLERLRRENKQKPIIDFSRFKSPDPYTESDDEDDSES